MSVMFMHGRVAIALSAFSFGFLLIPVPQLAAAAPETLAVIVDQAKIIKLPERVATIIVGNPLIADVTLQPGGMVIITGKGYGSTNMIAMDRAGAILTERSIQVEGTTDKLVTMYRGLERESYSCTPSCERRITLGDGKTYFDATLGQSGTLSGQATAAKP